MKATLIEPFLVVIVSLFWVIVLPFGALFCSATALSDSVGELSGRILGRFVRAQEGSGLIS